MGSRMKAAGVIQWEETRAAYPKEEQWMELRNAQEAWLSEQGDDLDVLSKGFRLSCSSVLKFWSFLCQRLAV